MPHTTVPSSHLTRRRSPVPALLAFAAAAALAPSLARAADGTWIGTTSAPWSDTTQWLGGTVADGSGSAANFATIDPTADLTVTLDAAHTLTNLTFADTDPTTAASWLISGGN